jgi:dienelactone hydrolase
MTEPALKLLLGVNRSRAVMAGMDVFRYDEVTSAIERIDQWPAAFSSTGDQLVAESERALAEGSRATASEALADAALWFHFATCVPSTSRESVAKLLQRAAVTHQRALELSGSRAERIGPERTDGVFAGILERPSGTGSPPIAVIVPGLDSSKEEFAPIARLLRRRGLATLRIDGPGQGEMLAARGPCAEYETVLARVIDVLQRTPDLDVTRIATVGLSLGGYYVPRVAAFERRLMAAVAVTGLYAFPVWETLSPMLRTILTLRAGGESAARVFASAVDLSPVSAKITIPLLVVAGGDDPMVSADDARRLAREVPSSTLLEVAHGDHLCANRRWEWQTTVADWVAKRLDHSSNQ